jgi:hypothetical protein
MQRLKFTKTLVSRSVHLIDVENLLGGVDFTEMDVTGLISRYSGVAPKAPLDHLVVASSHRAAPAVWFGWPEARRLVQSGPNGADLALLRVIEHERLAARYDRVVIGSGDGIFAEPAAALQELGVKVLVVARRDGLSRRLQMAARDVRFLDFTPEPSSAGNGVRVA